MEEKNLKRNDYDKKLDAFLKARICEQRIENKKKIKAFDVDLGSKKIKVTELKEVIYPFLELYGMSEIPLIINNNYDFDGFIIFKALIYFYGIGVDRDLKKAKEYFEIVNKFDNGNALQYLDFIEDPYLDDNEANIDQYLSGFEVIRIEKDKKKIESDLISHYPHLMFVMGNILYSEKGIECIDESMKWFCEAALLGHEGAIKKYEDYASISRGDLLLHLFENEVRSSEMSVEEALKIKRLRRMVTLGAIAKNPVCQFLLFKYYFLNCDYENAIKYGSIMYKEYNNENILNDLLDVTLKIKDYTNYVSLCYLAKDNLKDCRIEKLKEIYDELNDNSKRYVDTIFKEKGMFEIKDNE